MGDSQRVQSRFMEFPILTGIILAGGSSRRMGCDKAMLPVGGVSSIKRAQRCLEEVCDEVLISVNTSNPYDFTGLRTVEDMYTGKGPMAGLHACLRASRTEWNVVAACDMPFVSTAIIHGLLREVSSSGGKVSKSGSTGEAKSDETPLNAVIPVMDGQIQPLLALYHRDVLASLENRLKRNELRMKEWLGDLNILYISVEELSRLTGRSADRDLFNMNRPEDYEIACRWAEQLEDIEYDHK
ncbi:molybdenum cofactor guanylyltransferase [Paenibacillus sp. GCM10028914]|uniref:molybdenum cofactor guanylyltransferase n=1 Tax=Paenibacillus sp. GCM10028914 TaxID=3273416 RepID=UPI003619AF8C